MKDKKTVTTKKAEPKKETKAEPKEKASTTTTTKDSKETAKDPKKDVKDVKDTKSATKDKQVSKTNLAKTDIEEKNDVKEEPKKEEPKHLEPVDLKDTMNNKLSEIDSLKHNLQEKKQFQEEIKKLKSENEILIKKNKEVNNILNSLKLEGDNNINELTELYEAKDKLETEVAEKEEEIDGLEKTNKELQGEIDELKNQLSDMELDMEILKEESEGIKLEMEEKNSMGLISQISQLSGDESKTKILELETKYTQLQNQFLKLNEDKVTESKTYTRQIAKLAERAKLADDIPDKDKAIKVLNDRLTEFQKVINDLKDQLEVFSGASNMMDDLIMQKMVLEQENNKILKESQDIKAEMETTELLVNELDQAAKIANDIILEKENLIVNLNNSMNTLKDNIRDFDRKEKNFEKVMTDTKAENKILRDQLTLLGNVNIDELLEKTNSTSTSLATLKRRQVLPELYVIDNEYYKLKQSILDVMIPKSVFEKGNLNTFERYLTIHQLRKKSYHVIMNILENDLLKFDEENAEEDNTKFIGYCRTGLGMLTELNIICLVLEVFTSNMEKEEFKKLMKAIMSNISAIKNFMDGINNSIKEDTFSIKYSFDLLKSHISIIKQELQTTYGVDVEKCEYPIVVYQREILNYAINVIMYVQVNKHFDITVQKAANDVYNQTKRVLSKVNNQFKINFDDQVKVFELENNYFLNFKEVSKNGFDVEDKQAKYDGLLEVGVKLFVVMLNYLDKLEKEIAIKEQQISNESDHDYVQLPLKSWNEICLEIREELNNAAQTKMDLDNSLKVVSQTKTEKIELENLIEDLNRNKKINDRKLAETLVLAGKIPQLEMEKAEFNKKVEKYNITIESLQKNLDNEHEKIKVLQGKLENALASAKMDGGKGGARAIRNPGVGLPGMQRNTQVGVEGQNARASMLTSSLTTDSMPLLSTICDLQRERKLLKSKVMKERLDKLLEEDSYVNRYIKKVSKAYINETREDLLKIENEIENLNDNFSYVKKKLCTPKVLDITKNDYDYKIHRSKEDHKNTNLRIQYFQNIDTILFNMFGDQSLDKSFKDIIDNDITKLLGNFSQQKLLVGRISIKKFDEKNEKDDDKRKTVPIYLSETSLKALNKTFMH